MLQQYFGTLDQRPLLEAFMEALPDPCIVMHVCAIELDLLKVKCVDSVVFNGDAVPLARSLVSDVQDVGGHVLGNYKLPSCTLSRMTAFKEKVKFHLSNDLVGLHNGSLWGAEDKLHADEELYRRFVRRSLFAHPSHKKQNIPLPGYPFAQSSLRILDTGMCYNIAHSLLHGLYQLLKEHFLQHANKDIHLNVHHNE